MMIRPILLKINEAHFKLYDQNGGYKNNTGWLTAPNDFQQWLSSINQTAELIRQKAKALIVIGIGGSYLGTKTVIEAINGNFYNNFAEKNNSLEVYFAGNNINPNYLHDLIELVKDKDLCLIVISKSGGTLESAVAFRILRKIMEDKYAEKSKERIFVITDKNTGVLKAIADKEGYITFPVPENIGGRYSVLSPVGLLPIAAAGINISELLAGGSEAYAELQDISLQNNPAYQYAVVRNILYQKGKTIEILANYEPKMHSFGEWWKQLFGESEGKEGKGIFPATVDLTTDLHSMGQYIQEGQRNLFETTINIDLSFRDITLDPLNYGDGLEFLEGKTLDFANKQAFRGTVAAHTEGGVPNLIFNMPALSVQYLGKLIFNFEVACATSGMLLGVNPFDQPGVEKYKTKMLDLMRQS